MVKIKFKNIKYQNIGIKLSRSIYVLVRTRSCMSIVIYVT